MKTRKSPSLIGRLLWSLCLLQAVVLLASLAGMLYSLLDQNYSFIDEVVPDTLTEAVVLEADGPRLDAETLRPLRAEYPGLWAVVADARGRVVRLGATPADFETMVTILPLLGNSQINALEAQKHLTLRVDVREVAGEPVRIMSGGAAKSDFGRAILQATGILSLYFLLPMFLFTLIATPLLVLSATRGVKRLARDAAALDISRPDAQLAEESVPREVRP
ncbi:MAG TPA: hypothetical protein VLF16_14865, partial [Pseudomonas sp.]|nr:hypothetical protein [Pseudomonas sp.]